MRGVWKILEFLLGCLVLWGGVEWLGVGPIALALALFASWATSLTLNSSNGHSKELQELRERLTRLEQGLEVQHGRIRDEVDDLREQSHRMSRRIEAVTPGTFDDD